jgi:hypothetical protein
LVSEPLAAKQSNDPAITIDNNIIMAIKITFIKHSNLPIKDTFNQTTKTFIKFFENHCRRSF